MEIGRGEQDSIRECSPSFRPCPASSPPRFRREMSGGISCVYFTASRRGCEVTNACH